MNVLIMETDAGNISFFKARPIEWEGKYDSLDDFLLYVEQLYSSQGVITHGIIDEDDIPEVPEGGTSADLYWKDPPGELDYGDTYLKKSLLSERDSLLDTSSADLLIAIEDYHHDSGYDYRLFVHDPYFTLCKAYRDLLRDLDESIETAPYDVVFPVAPAGRVVPLFPTLEDHKQNKLNELQMAFNVEQAAGITSAALGTDHQYDMEQHNITWIVASAALTAHPTYTGVTPITCDDLNGEQDSKKERMHSEEGCKSLLYTGMTFIWNLKTKLRGLKAAVENAVDEDAVDAIEWALVATETVGWDA